MACLDQKLRTEETEMTEETETEVKGGRGEMH